MTTKMMKSNARHEAERKPQTSQQSLTRQQVYKKCLTLANQSNILAEFVKALEQSGLAAESRIAKLTYLTLTSRLLSSPSSMVVKGSSSSGKSFVVDRVLQFFPEAAFHKLTSMSEKALIHSRVPLVHKTLVIYEAAGIPSETCEYLMRSLLSEGHLRYETVGPDKQTITIEVPGPTGLIMTTTSADLHPENETRMLSTQTCETAEQTKAAMKAYAENDGKKPADLTEWRALQEWLAFGPTRVSVPFGVALAELVTPAHIRLRRDFPTLFNLIKSHALLHRKNRSRGPKGEVVATLEDYRAVRELVADIISAGIDNTISPTVRDTVNAVRLLEISNPTISLLQVAQALKIAKSSASRRLTDAIDLGFVKNLELVRGRPGKYAIASPMPEAISILPTCQELRAKFAASQSTQRETLKRRTS